VQEVDDPNFFESVCIVLDYLIWLNEIVIEDNSIKILSINKMWDFINRVFFFYKKYIFNLLI
jgi:hypothetical protein